MQDRLRTRSRRAGRLWPYVLVAFLYLATSPYHRGLNNPNEMVRIYMSKAMVDHHTFAIDPVVASWGMVDDKAIRDGRALRGLDVEVLQGDDFLE